MDESAFLGGAIAGVVYCVAGFRLIALSWRSHRSPEFLLGSSLLLWGLSYVCWQIPIATNNHPITMPLFFAGRMLTHAGTIFVAIFVQTTFRNGSRWARHLVYAIVLGHFIGVAGSIAVGDWEGVRPFSNPWWWADWSAGLVAVSWVGVEGFIQRRRTRKLVALGECDALTCHRFLLWAIVGAVWTVYSWVLLFQTSEYEAGRVWSIAMDRANGVVEALGVALVWIIFFPPRFYKRWISSRSGAPAPEAS